MKSTARGNGQQLLRNELRRHGLVELHGVAESLRTHGLGQNGGLAGNQPSLLQGKDLASAPQLRIIPCPEPGQGLGLGPGRRLQLAGEPWCRRKRSVEL